MRLTNREDRLAPAVYGTIAAAATALFVVQQLRAPGGPFAVDAAAYSSYLVIPAAVALALFVGRRLAWRALVLDTLEIAVIKFAVTYAYAAAFWAFSPAPRRPPPPRPLTQLDARLSPVRASPAVPRVPLPPPERAGVVRGAVSGPPALVFLRDAPATEAPLPALELRYGADGASPALSVVQVGAPIEWVSDDTRLHTLQGLEAGRVAFNWPMLPLGRGTQLLSEPGFFDLRCSVDGPQHRPHPARLLVVDHPFAQVVGAAGAFRFERVPAGRYTLVAAAADGRPVERSVEVVAGQTTEVRLPLVDRRVP